MRRGVNNFFGNFADAWSAVNNMLQGKVAAGFEDVTRVGTNTVFGLGGVLDVATRVGPRAPVRRLRPDARPLGRRRRCLRRAAAARARRPCATPSRCRSTAARRRRRCRRRHGHGQIGLGAAADRQHPRQPARRDAACIDDIALDKYTFIRDAYLQRRRSLVFDGDAPETPAAPEDAASARRRRGGRHRRSAAAARPRHRRRRRAGSAPQLSASAGSRPAVNRGPVRRVIGASASPSRAGFRTSRTRELCIQGTTMSIDKNDRAGSPPRRWRWPPSARRPRPPRRPMR